MPSCSGGKSTKVCKGCGAKCPGAHERPMQMKKKAKKKPDWWHMEVVIRGEGKFYETMAGDARALKKEYPGSVKVNVRGKR